MLHLAANIRLIRVLKGKSHQDFAELLGPPATKDIIYTYEKGIVKKPNLILLQRIADLAQIPIEELLNKKLSEHDIDVIDPQTKKMEYRLSVSNERSEIYAEFEKVISQKDKVIADQQLLIERLMKLLSTDSK